MQSWIELLAATRRTAVVDIGANPIDGDPPYAPMLAAGLCTVVGFEPQADALAKLHAAAGPHERYLQHAVGDGGGHELKVTWMNGMTSLFEPDVARLSALNEFARYGQVLERIPVATTRLDDVPDLGPLDLLKIDVQGSELMVFQNGRRTLADAVAVHTEVSFVPLYQDQPLFADVDAELRAQGFLPHAFAAVKRWPISPGSWTGTSSRPTSSSSRPTSPTSRTSASSGSSRRNSSPTSRCSPTTSTPRPTWWCAAWWNWWAGVTWTVRSCRPTAASSGCRWARTGSAATCEGGDAGGPRGPTSAAGRCRPPRPP